MFLYGLKGFGVDVEFKLRGKANGPHHAQRVVAECARRIERRAYELLLKVVDAAERIHELAIGIAIEADGHGINGEISPFLVVLQAAWLHLGLATVGTVAFLAGAYKFKVKTVGHPEMGGTKVFEKVHAGLRLEITSRRIGQLERIARTNEIGILCRPFEQLITYETANEVTRITQLLRGFRNLLENFFLLMAQADIHAAAKIEIGRLMRKERRLSATLAQKKPAEYF